jgi:hypothetical protein
LDKLIVGIRKCEAGEGFKTIACEGQEVNGGCLNQDSLAANRLCYEEQINIKHQRNLLPVVYIYVCVVDKHKGETLPVCKIARFFLPLDLIILGPSSPRVLFALQYFTYLLSVIIFDSIFSIQYTC